MENFPGFLLLARQVLPVIGLMLFVWGTLDNYFLTRYGGKINRGFTIWSQPLRPDERQFLENLKEDIVDINQKRIGFQTITKTSFIAKNNQEVLIRYSRIGQGTSCPIVGYVDLSLPGPVLEYRLSFPMLLGIILIMLINIIVVVVLSVAFLVSWLFETGGLRSYLSRKVDLSAIRLTPQNQKGYS